MANIVINVVILFHLFILDDAEYYERINNFLKIKLFYQKILHYSLAGDAELQRYELFGKPWKSN